MIDAEVAVVTDAVDAIGVAVVTTNVAAKMLLQKMIQ